MVALAQRCSPAAANARASAPLSFADHLRLRIPVRLTSITYPVLPASKSSSKCCDATLRLLSLASQEIFVKPRIRSYQLGRGRQPARGCPHPAAGVFEGPLKG